MSSEAVEVDSKVAFHERRFFLAMNGLMVSFLIDMIVVSIVMLTNGGFDPGVFLFVPIAATAAFGVLAVYYEKQAKNDKVRMDYFEWIMDKVFGKPVK